MSRTNQPVYTQAERDAILNYREMRRRDKGAQAGSIIEDVGRAAGGQDPLHRYQLPGADNLTAAEKAKLMQGYADILAKLAQAEREAQSSDQDYASKMVIARNGILEEMIKASASLGVADKQVAIAKVNQQSEIAQAGTKQYEAAQAALTLSPEGQAMVGDLQKQVLSSGVVNPTAALQMVNTHLGQLSKTNPAQIPAYLNSVNAGFRATGRPEYRDFDVESLLSKMDPSDPGQVVLIQQIAGSIQRGDAAAQTQAQLYQQGYDRATQAEQALMKLNGGMPEPLRSLMNDLTSTLRTAPTTDLSPQQLAPPASADLGAKKAYVERASGGQQTLNAEGNVVSAAPTQGGGVAPTGAGPVTSYEGFVQVYPGVRTDGAASAGGMAPTGGGYSRSGPTQDSIASMRKLRERIEVEMGNLDKRNLDPLTLARLESQQAIAGSAQGGLYDNARFAQRAAERTAAAEERGLRRADREVRDNRVLAGMDAAPVREQIGATVRGGLRGLMRLGEDTGGTLTGRERLLRPNEPQAAPAAEGAPSTPDRTEDAQRYLDGAKKALLAGDPEWGIQQVHQFVNTASSPQQLREAAKLYESFGDKARSEDAELKADNMEYALEQAQRSIPRPDDGRPWDTSLRVRQPSLRQAARAQELLETDPTIPSIEDWQPQVPGRRNLSPQAGRDFQRVEEGRTLSDRTGKDPLSSVYSMGDFGATANANEMAASPNAEVPFERVEPAQRQRVNLGVVRPTKTFESTGGDSETGEKPADAASVGQALSSFGQRTERPEQKSSVTPAEPDAVTDRYWRNFIKTSNELLVNPNAVPERPAPSAMPIGTVSEPMSSSTSTPWNYRPQTLNMRVAARPADPRYSQFGGRTQSEQDAWVEQMRRTTPEFDISKIKGSREEFEDVPIEDIPDWMKDPSVPVPGIAPTPVEALAESDPGLLLRRRQRAVVDGAVSQ